MCVCVDINEFYRIFRPIVIYFLLCISYSLRLMCSSFGVLGYSSDRFLIQIGTQNKNLLSVITPFATPSANIICKMCVYIFL